MPVDRGVLVQPVLECRHDALAAPYPVDREGCGPFRVGPQGDRRPLRTQEAERPLGRDQLDARGLAQRCPGPRQSEAQAGGREAAQHAATGKPHAWPYWTTSEGSSRLSEPSTLISTPMPPTTASIPRVWATSASTAACTMAAPFSFPSASIWS